MDKISGISVIIPVHNGGQDFLTCLFNLSNATPPPDEIIVIDDGGTDNSWRAAEEFCARVTRLPKAGGPAKARNLGARLATNDILFFVDADVALAPDAIGQVRSVFLEHPDVVATFGSYDDQPAAENFLSQYKNLFHRYNHQIGLEDASTFWSGCGAIKRDVFLQMGGFDEGYPQPCIEDIELGYRLKQAGYKIRLHKTLQGKHLKRWTAGSLVKTDFLRRALPWTELILRDRQLVNDLNLGGSSRASVMLVFLLLGSVGGALLWPWFLAVAGLLALALVLLNLPVYRFFLAERDLWFTIGVIPWHWFYYFYGGVAFILGATFHHLRRWGLPAISYLPAPREKLVPTED